MNINELMRQAKKMQDKLQQVREEAGNKTVEGTAGGGMITVVANGKNEILSVKIDPKVVDPAEIEMLQDLIVAAANQALTRANELMQGEIAKVTGGLQVPGMF